MSSDPAITPFAAPAAGLAAEMTMLAEVAAGRAGPSAFLWEAKAPGLVLPERFTRDARFADAAARCAAAGWPVTARRTGGGITPQGPGVLNLALAFTVAPGRARTIRDSYAAICTPLVEALGALGVTAEAAPVTGSFCDGADNLAVAGRKIVGTAQRWRGTACLAHALILTEIDLPPAVAAVQRLSDGLGHADRFEVAMHCRLADLLACRDVTDTAAWHIRQAVTARGYAAWPGPAGAA